jgi:methylmalonyl-CoA mutase N-terminal domain/subunit
MDSGEEFVVGLNCYRDESEEIEVPVFRVDEEIEKRAIDRIKAYRDHRDEGKYEEALERLQTVAFKVKEGELDDFLIEALMDAYRAGATLGDTMAILKEVFGYGYVY